ncbi:hypothetical protein IDSA_03905 [Pseudidiomarina salinarum]|uniref:Uncharacterized protein n=1 Tax=Pseudidiomarina salinarum TaxID=435908 RepID=A0A094LAJ6_9GAMM|nr:hypothetical protein IDSA_03905 [Pseudidiomarina salinarum]RUO70391.1 hypothetical protein CWI79_02680 [Pseudidiomarina salinarum]
MSYFHQVDSIGHRFGTDSPQTRAAVLFVDNLIGSATGPGIANEAKLSRLSVVDIYPLVTALLGLPITEAIDGDAATIAPLLQ